MTTYERGKEPQGAPVVWEYVVHEGCEIMLDSGEILRGLHASDADEICRALWVVELAKEYAAAGDDADKSSSGGADHSAAMMRWRAAADALRKAVR